jgi:hypothetical protein
MDPSDGECPVEHPFRILRDLRRPIHPRRDQMLRGKSKLAYVLLAAAVLASFLAELGWHW